VLLPALEAALEGLSAGAHKTVELAARDAYGERDPASQLEFARDEFASDVAPGDRLELERDDGSVVVVSVLDVNDEGVVVDLNHPLAGQRVRFEIEVLEARPATAEELQIAESALEAGEEDPEEATGGLIPPSDLLRRGGRS
jgi:FKBP-type peptidyl-prolyl cis-trans isomerase SlyD